MIASRGVLLLVGFWLPAGVFVLSAGQFCCWLVFGCLLVSFTVGSFLFACWSVLLLGCFVAGSDRGVGLSEVAIGFCGFACETLEHGEVLLVA